MLITRHTVFFSNTIRRRLIHGTATYLLPQLNEEKQNAWKKSKLEKSSESKDPKELLKLLSNTSVKPFLNVDKIDLLKEYCRPQKDVTSAYSFIIDENVAKDIVEKITASEKRRKGIIAEGNPGLGLITVNLINSGVPHIFVFEQSEIQNVALTQLINSKPGKITLKAGNTSKNLDPLLLTTLDAGRQHGLPVTIIGVSTGFYILRGLVISFVKYQLWPDEFEAFLVLSTHVWNGIKQHDTLFKFPIQCLFHVLFTVEEVAKYPRDAFLPLSYEDSEDMHLIRLSVNPNAFDCIKREELNEYFCFLKILGTKLNNFVIPVLEKWLPDCGLYLISKGMSMTTQVRDLSHDDAVLLYNFLKEWEGYPDFKSLIISTRN